MSQQRKQKPVGGAVKSTSAIASWSMRVFPLSALLLLLLLQASAVPIRHPRQWALPDYSVYHTKDKLLEQVVKVVEQHSAIMKMKVETAGEPAYRTDMQVVTVEPGGHTDDHTNKIRILLDFGEHARELVSSETGLAFLRILGDPEEIRRVTGEMHPQIAALLPYTVFKILPMENTLGRRKVELGDLCERKNGRGVDPNRNWEVDWGVKERDYDPKEEYPGTHPFSEPEVQIVKQIVEAWHPHVWVNVHSGMEALFMPFDHKAIIPPGSWGQAQLGMLKHLNKLVCGDRCAVGSGGKSVGYLAHGTATDHMFLKERVPLSFTWEIYGDTKAHYLDCFRMFNPLTKEHLDRVVSAWAPGFLYLLALLPTHPALATFMEQARIPLPGAMHRQVSQQAGLAGRPLTTPRAAAGIHPVIKPSAETVPHLPRINGPAGSSTANVYAKNIAGVIDAHVASAAAESRDPKAVADAVHAIHASGRRPHVAAWWWPLGAVGAFFGVAILVRAAGGAMKRRRRRSPSFLPKDQEEDPRDV